MNNDEPVIRVGQLWRRRRDGRRFITAHRVADGWLDLQGFKRSEGELHKKYFFVPIDMDDARPPDGH